jgi:hypothetical protein
MNAMAYSAMAMVATGGCLIAQIGCPRTRWQSVRDSRATIVLPRRLPPMLTVRPTT